MHCPPAQVRTRKNKPRVYGLPLADNWQAVLYAEPPRVLGDRPPLDLAANDTPSWAQLEYGRSRLSDTRLRERLVAMGDAWQERRGATLPVIFPGLAAQKAAYRFLSNKHVRVPDILEPHQAAMVARCQSQSPILAVEDTTMLYYSGYTPPDGLVAIGGGGSGAKISRRL